MGAIASSPALSHCDRCLVLGGGGVTGIAWQIGLVAGLAQAGVFLRDADCFIGTSAGSVVAAQLAGDAPLQQLLDAQLGPASKSVEQFRPYSQADADEKNRVLLEKVHGDLAQARRRIGAFALRSVTPPLAARRAIVAARLSDANWPKRQLKVVAVDAQSGEPGIFDSGSGVDFVDAIAASCAVPGVWPTVPIGDRRYMDGGMRSITNADLAVGARRVLVIAPFGYSDGNPVSGHLAAEVAALRAGGSLVEVVMPDARALAAIGENVLDPARMGPAAKAGIDQAGEAAERLASFWSSLMT